MSTVLVPQAQEIGKSRVPPPAGIDVRRIARFLRQNVLFDIGLLIVGFSLFLAAFGPLIAPYDPVLPTPEVSAPPPSLASVPGLIIETLQGKHPHPVHWFGTELTGLDIFSRVLAAPRVDVLVGLAATSISFVLGTVLGLIAGFFRTRSAETIIRISDTFQSFPIFILAMIFVVLTGRNVIDVIITLAALYTPIYLRLTCSQVVSQVGRTYVEAARAVGNREIVIALKHVLPNSLTPAPRNVSPAVNRIAQPIVTEAWISAGVRPPTAEWGIMVAEGAGFMVSGEWWIALFPGLALMIAVFCFNLLGDGLRDIVDPQRRT